jgi:4-amino-4-deoxychorismate lyase
MNECLVNGEISTLVETSNRGLNYGDGLFETLLVQNGRPHRWQAHMDRLGTGCERLGLPMPPQSILLREVQTVSAGLVDAVVKIIISRGGVVRTYMPQEDENCVRIVSAHRYPKGIAELARKGVRARICDLRLAIQPALGGMKHLNRLEQVLASAELRKTGVAEGILLDRDDNVVCAVSANIFLVMEDQLLTPRLDLCGVRGVVRAHILANFSARCEQRRVTLDMLHEADEVFVCNTVKGIVPVTAIDEHEFDIGLVTREMQTWLMEGTRQT